MFPIIDPRTRSLGKLEFVRKFLNSVNSKAMDNEKYQSVILKVANLMKGSKVQELYKIVNTVDTNGQMRPRLVDVNGREILPLEEVFDLIEKEHVNQGGEHVSHTVLWNKLKSRYSTGNISLEMVRDFVRRCSTCAYKYTKKNKNTEDLPPPDPQSTNSSTLNKNMRENFNGLKHQMQPHQTCKNSITVSSQSTSTNFPYELQKTAVLSTFPSHMAAIPQTLSPIFPTNSKVAKTNEDKTSKRQNWMPKFTSTPLIASKKQQMQTETGSSKVLLFSSLQTDSIGNENEQTTSIQQKLQLERENSGADASYKFGPTLESGFLRFINSSNSTVEDTYQRNILEIINEESSSKTMMEPLAQNAGVSTTTSKNDNSSANQVVSKTTNSSINSIIDKASDDKKTITTLQSNNELQEIILIKEVKKEPLDNQAENLEHIVENLEYLKCKLLTEKRAQTIMVEFAKTKFAGWQLVKSKSRGSWYFYKNDVKPPLTQWVEPEEWLKEICNRLNIADIQQYISENYNSEEPEEDEETKTTMRNPDDDDNQNVDNFHTENNEKQTTHSPACTTTAEKEFDQQPTKDGTIESLQSNKETITGDDQTKQNSCVLLTGNNEDIHENNDYSILRPFNNTIEFMQLISTCEDSNVDQQQKLDEVEQNLVQDSNAVSSNAENSTNNEPVIEEAELDIRNYIENFEEQLIEEEPNFCQKINNTDLNVTDFRNEIISEEQQIIQHNDIDQAEPTISTDRLLENEIIQQNLPPKHQVARKTLSTKNPVTMNICRTTTLTGPLALDEKQSSDENDVQIIQRPPPLTKLPGCFILLPKSLGPILNALNSKPIDYQKIEKTSQESYQKIQVEIERRRSSKQLYKQESETSPSDSDANDQPNTSSFFITKKKKKIKKIARLSIKKEPLNESYAVTPIAKRLRRSNAIPNENRLGSGFFCVRCAQKKFPLNRDANTSYNSEMDYQKHMIEYHNVILSDNNEFVKKHIKRRASIEDLEFSCEKCEQSFDGSTSERCQKWVKHRKDIHGEQTELDTDDKESIPFIVANIELAQSYGKKNPYLSIKKEKNDDMEMEWLPARKISEDKLWMENKGKSKRGRKKRGAAIQIKREVKEELMDLETHEKPTRRVMINEDDDDEPQENDVKQNNTDTMVEEEQKAQNPFAYLLVRFHNEHQRNVVIVDNDGQE